MNPKKKNACVLMLRAKIFIWEKIVSLCGIPLCAIFLLGIRLLQIEICSSQTR